MNLDKTENKSTIFLDIDGVMVTTHQYFGKYHKEYNGHPYDPKCVKVLNEIIEKTNSVIVLSSDWKLHFTLIEMNNIFKINGINDIVSDYTPSLWGVGEGMFGSLQQLEECRAAEIQKYVDEHGITNWVAIDDLNLFPHIPLNFVWCTRENEGIKQSGVKDKILNILNN